MILRETVAQLCIFTEAKQQGLGHAAEHAISAPGVVGLAPPKPGLRKLDVWPKCWNFNPRGTDFRRPRLAKPYLRATGRVGGFRAVTVPDIGDGAGYTNAALFQFFPTKDTLALYLFERCYLALFESLSAAMRPDMPFADQLHAIVTVFISQIERDPDAFLFVQDQLRQMWPRVSRSIRRHSILVLIRATLEHGVRENKVRSMANFNLLIAAITGTLQQFARMLSFGEFPGPTGGLSGELEQIILHIVSP